MICRFIVSPTYCFSGAEPSVVAHLPWVSVALITTARRFFSDNMRPRSSALLGVWWRNISLMILIVESILCRGQR